MSNLSFCTWAPSVFASQQMSAETRSTHSMGPTGGALDDHFSRYCRWLEDIGVSHVLIAQRWWGSGVEMEASSLDCLAITSHIAARTERLQLITAIHPGFFHPTAIAKWGATLSRLTNHRWSINVTSGWNLKEFSMYGVDALEHDERYQRTSEFIEVLRGAWSQEIFDYNGRYYHAQQLRLEPRPLGPLTVYQGGQSTAAIHMAAQHSDWMFLNGGSLEKTASIIETVRAAARQTGRVVRFALYGIPLCRDTDAAAWAEIEGRLAKMDDRRVEERRHAVSGAQGMWSASDRLSLLDSNEGYASGLIGSPATIIRRIQEFQSIGVEMLHLGLQDQRFVSEVLPQLRGPSA